MTSTELSLLRKSGIYSNSCNICLSAGILYNRIYAWKNEAISILVTKYVTMFYSNILFL